MTDLDSLLREADEHDKAATPGEWRSKLEDASSTALVMVEQAGVIAHCFSPRGRRYRIDDAKFIAWSRTAVPKLAAAVRELRERQQKIQAFVDAQSNDPALWCEAVHISEAYLQQALRKLHACIDGEDISWLEHGD
jgi:hypothetical protein